MAKPDKQAKQAEAARRQLVRRVKKTAIWIGMMAVAGGLIYLLATSSGVRFDEDDLAIVDFSGLNRAQVKTALEAANAARCTCGCGMDVAQCVATDSTCPLRTGNISRIQKMVEDAKKSSS